MAKTYTKPSDAEESKFDPRPWAENKTIRANQTRDAIISAFIAGYEDFWGVQDGTSRHTKEEMQAIVDDMPDALDILMDAAKFKEFASTAFPGEVPDKYGTGVFATTVDPTTGRVLIGDLIEAWIVDDEINSHEELSEGE